MKSKLIFILFLVSFQAMSNQIELPILAVYSPLGFDSNDNSQVMISGYLPNLCFKGPRSKSIVIGNNIFVSVTAHRSRGANFCPEMVVPFDLVADLGQLRESMYNIFVNGKSEFRYRSSIFISPTNSDHVDSFIYANVESVEVKDGYLHLKGKNYGDCVVLDQINIISNRVNTYSVLPRMKLVKRQCNRGSYPFAYKVKFDNHLKVKKALFHVRVMDGRAINRVIDL